MKSSHKVLFGLSVAVEFAGIAAFFAFALYTFTQTPANARVEDFQNFIVIGNLLGLAVTAYCTAILVLFVIHASRNPVLESRGNRTTWILSLVILGLWAQPFYWFYYIYRDGASAGRRVGPLGLN